MSNKCWQCRQNWPAMHHKLRTPLPCCGVLVWEAAAQLGPHFSDPLLSSWGHNSCSHQGNVHAIFRQKDQELGAPTRVSVPVCWLNKEESEILKAGRARRRREPGPLLATQQTAPTAMLALDYD